MIPFPFQFGGLGLAGSSNVGPPPASDLADEILADSPFCYYELGETLGATTYADSSGNGYSLGNVVATVTAGSTALCAPGTSVDFAGGYISSTANQYDTAQQTAFDGDKAFSIVVVLNIGSLAADRCFVHLGNVSVNGSQGFFLYVMTNGTVRLQWFNDGVDYLTLDTASGAVTTGTTYMIHARRDVGGAAAIFVDGASAATGTMAGNIAMNAGAGSGGQRIMVGALNASSPSTQMDGRLQHVAVFPSYLSDARISAHFTASGL